MVKIMLQLIDDLRAASVQRLSGIAIFSGCLLFGIAAPAQTAHFSGSVIRLPFAHQSESGLWGIAVDRDGNVYIADMFANLVLKETPSGGAYTESTVADAASNGLNYPLGLAVDGQGSVYIADNGNNRLLKETPSAGGYTQSTVMTTVPYEGPVGVTVDKNGNVYISTDCFDGDNPNVYGCVLKGTPSGPGGSYTETIVADPASNGLSAPAGVAVDGSGDVYIVDPFNNRVLKETPSGNSYSQSVVAGSPSMGLSETSGVAVDGSGNVYIGDVSTADAGGGQILKETPSAGTYNQTTLVPAGIDAQQVAVDANGNVYITQIDDAYEEIPSGVSFGAVDVGSSSQYALGFYYAGDIYQIFTFDTGGTIQGRGAAVLTQGATGLDFLGLDPFECSVGGTYNAGDACMEIAYFNPTAPGDRYGAVALYNTSGNVIATSYLQGTGVGPLLAFEPSPPAAIDPTVGSKGLSEPSGVALDGAGDLFIADAANNRVVEAPAGGGAAIAIDPKVDGFGLNEPSAVEVDGAGNLFIADTGNNRVVEVPAGGSTAIAIDPKVDGIGLNEPSAVSADGAGDLLIADTANNRVLEVYASGGAANAIDPSVGGIGLNRPKDVAVDGAGDLFIVDSGNGRVVEVPAGAGTPVAIEPIVDGKGLSSPSGVAVDGAGDLFIGDYSNKRVVEVPAGEGAAVAIVPAVSGKPLLGPAGLDVDGAGDLFIADRRNNRVVELQRSQPSSLSFAGTVERSTSTDSPKTVQVTNSGNAMLIITGIGYPADFPEAGGDANACTASTKLGPGQQCDLPIDFTPQSPGQLSENVTLTDNSLNVAGSKQTIGVSGIGRSTQTITFTPPANPVTYGVKPIALSATASSGLAVKFSVVSGPAKVSGSSLTITGAGTVVVAANQAGNADYTAAAQVTQTVTVDKAKLTVSATNKSMTYGGAVPALTYTITGFVNGDKQATATTGAPSLATTATSASPAGSYSITAWAGTLAAANYTFQFDSGTLTVAKAKLTVTANNLSMKQGAAVPTLTYTMAGLVNGDMQAKATSGQPVLSTTATSKSAPGKYPITITAGTLAAPNYSFTLVKGTLTVTK